jgi:hypothetical protein
MSSADVRRLQQGRGAGPQLGCPDARPDRVEGSMAPPRRHRADATVFDVVGEGHRPHVAEPHLDAPNVAGASREISQREALQDDLASPGGT